ncbi:MULTISPECIES: signal recognition particle-docking protein FtsY [unclassified Pseudomonas]|uniref:signal recognition particle-docking protein FtsY n=1 Tax=unclassified Pseudomonas TaxID=196821 RepID=UPI00244D7AC6|nr:MULTISPECIES: signal recognition particle-docking protein FtsY [unclassified Pseudomonas]MDG9922522.1 signal recognition particle-docking protein FtsY [Pseudomonas sp. GD04045]MDH0034280.1 signal recognition particle-docking protein FtsY [Pseudomonas sp. GD04019]
MFGSQDDKPSPEQPGEKKSLFGWLRKKPDAPATAEQPQPEPATEPSTARVEPETAANPAPVTETSAEPVVVAPVAAPVVEPVPEPVATAPEPVPTPVAVQPPIEHLPVVEAAPLAEEPKPAFSRFRINAGSEVTHPVHETPVEPAPHPEPVAAPAPVEQSKPGDNQGGWFARLKQGLSKTSASLGEGMASLFLGKKAIDDDLLEELETRLLMADVGVEATSTIIGSLTKRVARKELADSGALYKALQEELGGLLKPVEQPLAIPAEKQPYVILVVGVNGVGKTTTIGKLAKKLQGEGKKVMLAAGDTFRAAAVEQLQVWGERNQIAVIAQHTGADSASVIFDAVQAAKARGVDVLIADTAGRLHTKDNLMEELKKVRRVIGKLDDTAPHEVLLVLDAGTGQNAINQTKQFNQAVTLTGLALTKLDGTAKGGVIFALAKQFGLPIRYIGVGEGIDDLRTFVAADFVQALFAEKEQG